MLGEERFAKKERRMKRYMMSHIDSWLAFASEVTGERLAVEDLVFVQGHFKTTRRAISALVDNRGSPSTRIDPFADPDSDRMDVDPLASGEYGHESPEDQCVFMHYMKMKKQLSPVEEPIVDKIQSVRTPLMMTGDVAYTYSLKEAIRPRHMCLGLHTAGTPGPF